ncbi:zinc ribbon domain-containing protein [Leucobacter sp. CSA2]|uniref:Zinc ribbon domain-containing protein n=1 Tax=Leucobacter edaphi TaxID=2796472 RepID=A0A934Q9U9_9MICO|nr:FmdB family zinc ribbon protein [Leucobacter edaphi]MBK0420825.1 zinc ribbon domain-containing protein [Leucobacter edaphi]
MPSYSFRCEAGCRYDAMYSMAEVPKTAECRVCGAEARRAVTAPHLSGAGSSAFKLVDSAARSAHEPQVVGSLPTAGPAKRQPVTRNPLHAKLPRP